MMNPIDNSNMSHLLNQLRVQAALAQGRSLEAEGPAQGVDFASLLKQTIDQVNNTQHSAKEMATAFETGDTQMGLEEVMIARQKATISFQVMLQVRNKLVNAYQEIMSMPL